MPQPKLLIVEDNPNIKNYLSSLFTNAGYQVSAESDGAIGLDLAEAGGFTAIILDLKMPHVDGLSFLKKLGTKKPTVPNGPIIIYSSAEYEYAREEALKTGATLFIKKDEYDSAQLVEKVQEIINQHQSKNE